MAQRMISSISESGNSSPQSIRVEDEREHTANHFQGVVRAAPRENEGVPALDAWSRHRTGMGTM